MAMPKSNDGPSSAETAQEIKSLLQQLRKSFRKKRRRGNGSGGSDRDDALRLDKLRKIFAQLIEQQELDLNAGSNQDTDGDGNSARSQWKTWLTTQHEVFIAYLLESIVDGKTTALRTFCGVLASSPVDIVGLSKDGKNNDGQNNGKGSDGMVSQRLLNKLLEACVKSRQCLDVDTNKSSTDTKNTNEKITNEVEGNEKLVSEEAMLTLLEAEFIRPHRDVQYFICKGVHQIALDLLSGLDRVNKRAVSKGGGENRDDGDGIEESESSGDSDGGIAKAEMNTGIVAENLCRLLMTMTYVPKNQSDLMGDAQFLYAPPILSVGENVDNDADGDDGSVEDNDSDDDDSSDSSDSSSEEEVSVSGDKRPLPSSKTNGGSKRTKKTKLIAWQRPYKHRHAHQEAWLSVLRLPDLPLRTQKRVLQHLSTYVLNVCPSPLRFAEYFTRSFQAGTTGSKSTTMTSGGGGGGSSSSSLTAILSLHGLFILMLDHQLEYPQFYNSLYTLLHPRILYTKHRSRFLRLLSKSLLSNSMLPAYVAASFCKKLCRLALSGPPSGGLFVLALVSNLLRKHGECACLIHRRGVIMEDVFEEGVDDLIKTRALESSLWELTALEKHYHSAISTLAKSVGKEDDKTTPMYDMEDFMTHTYKSLFEQEKKRLGGGKEKKGGSTRVSLTFVEPESLFTKDDVFGNFFQCS